MRQNKTVIAPSREVRAGVCCGRAIRGTFRRGVGWPSLYRQSMQHSSSIVAVVAVMVAVGALPAIASPATSFKLANSRKPLGFASPLRSGFAFIAAPPRRQHPTYISLVPKHPHAQHAKE